EGRLISAPPAAYSHLLHATDAHTGSTLQNLLYALPPSTEINDLDFTPVGGKDSWRIHSTHFRPLGWTIVAAVPEADFTRAATDLRNQLGFFLLLVLAAGLT